MPAIINFADVRWPSYHIGGVCFSSLARSRPLVLYYRFTPIAIGVPS